MKKSDGQDEGNDMKIFAIINTNVIISALLSKHNDAATVLVLDSIYTGTLIPVYNEDILKEYTTVLRRSKFRFPETLIERTLNAIRISGIHTDRIHSGEILPDPKDLVFYEVALSVDDSFLVTSNIKHFPKEPFIVTPAELLRIINEISSGDKRLLNEPQAPYGKQ